MASNPSGMKVLFLDIETTPIEAYTWGIWQQNVAISQIIAPTRMLCWAAKWEGEDYVYFASEKDWTREVMVQEIYDLVCQADAVCHYNGTQFDMKHLNREFLELGLPPPENYKNIDLLRVVKQSFKFPSNKLEYVALTLGIGSKLENPGMKMWIDALAGDAAAWQLMEEYNVQDVLLLERLYEKLQGWIKGHPNRALWVEDQSNPICPNCGGTHLILKGIERPARVNAYQRYKCNDCGANSRGRKIISKAGAGVVM